MDALKSWALMLLFVCAGAFVFFHLLPSGNLSQTAKSVAAVLCMASVLIPVFRVFGGNTVSFPEFSGAVVADTEALLSYYADSAGRMLEDTVACVMEKFGIKSYVLEAQTDITANGCIDIKRVLITLETPPEDIHALAVELKGALGIAPKIEVKE